MSKSVGSRFAASLGSDERPSTSMPLATNSATPAGPITSKVRSGRRRLPISKLLQRLKGPRISDRAKLIPLIRGMSDHQLVDERRSEANLVRCHVTEEP